MAGEQTKVDWPALISEALTTPGNMMGVFDRFWNYSFTNTILFRMQGYREPMASMKRWNGLGRKIKVGSRAGEVIVPLMVSKEQPDSDDPEKRERVQLLVGFKVLRAVFGLSDTEGEALPPQPKPGWDYERALSKLDIREVPWNSTNGNVQGYSYGLEFAINPIAVHPHKTRFHEIAHIVLGHTLPHSLDDYRTHQGIKEFQAEAVALLCMNELELGNDVSNAASRAYVQHWLANERPPDKAIQQVFTATDRILRAGRVAVGDTIPDA